MKIRKPTRIEIEEAKNVHLGNDCLTPAQEYPKTWEIQLEAENISIEFSNVLGPYKVQSICHELVRLCNELRISSNTLTVTELIEKDKT